MFCIFSIINERSNVKKVKKSFHSKGKQYQLFGVFICSNFRGVIFKQWFNDKRWYIYLEILLPPRPSVNECPVKKISRKEKKNFKFQIYFRSSVQFSCIWCLKSVVWFANLSLNGVSKAPKYIFWLFVIVASYSILGIRHLFSRGELSFYSTITSKVFIIRLHNLFIMWTYYRFCIFHAAVGHFDGITVKYFVQGITFLKMTF